MCPMEFDAVEFIDNPSDNPPDNPLIIHLIISLIIDEFVLQSENVLNFSIQVKFRIRWTYTLSE